MVVNCINDNISLSNYIINLVEDRTLFIYLKTLKWNIIIDNVDAIMLAKNYTNSL